MIVEFIGSTGAGKTTLASEVQRRLSQNFPSTTSSDLFAEMVSCRNICNDTFRNLIADIVGFPFFLYSLKRNYSFFIFTLKTLSRHNNNTLFTANYLRGIVRRIGTYEFLQRYKRDRIILVDEGTIHTAHLLFVFNKISHYHNEIQIFASLVPLPELVICIEAPVDSLVDRSLNRSDVRRELKSKHPKMVEKYIKRALEVFDRITSIKEIRDRVLILKSNVSDTDDRSIMADHITRFILSYQPNFGPTPTPQ